MQQNATCDVLYTHEFFKTGKQAKSRQKHVNSKAKRAVGVEKI